MKLSEYRNEDAIDLLADLIEPASKIMADRKVVTGFKSGNMMKAVKATLKGHQKELIEILSIMDGISPKEANYSVGDIITKSLDLLNDEETMSFFTSQASRTTSKSSGSATVNTEGNETK